MRGNYFNDKFVIYAVELACTMNKITTRVYIIKQENLIVKKKKKTRKPRKIYKARVDANK